jgi:peroxiredoxin
MAGVPGTAVNPFRACAGGAAVATDPFQALPEGLPVPVDDGACAHLPGAPVPDLSLGSTGSRNVWLGQESDKGRIVLFVYPRTGAPGTATRPEWDAIPGARGCTPQACGFRDLHAEFAARGCKVYGLSAQPTGYHQEMAERLHLPFEVLSDAKGRLQQAWRLPTFTFEGERLLRRVTLVLRDRRVEKVFYPVFPPDRNAQAVLDWLDTQVKQGGR